MAQADTDREITADSGLEIAGAAHDPGLPGAAMFGADWTVAGLGGASAAAGLGGASAAPARPAPLTVVELGDGPTPEAIAVPGRGLFLRAEFGREGPDLIASLEDGSSVLVRDFFARSHDALPDFVTQGGAVLPGHVAYTLAGGHGPIQLAQAEGGVTEGVLESVGSVTRVRGEATILRADGTQLQAAEGTAVFASDTLQTADDGGITVVFTDGTEFALGARARLIVSDFQFDTGTGSGQALLNVTNGPFSFISGEVAGSGPGALTVDMPAMSLGVRGTMVAGNGGQRDEDAFAVLLREPDGSLGAFDATDKRTGVTIPVETANTLYDTGTGQTREILGQEFASLVGDPLSLLSRSSADSALHQPDYQPPAPRNDDDGGGNARDRDGGRDGHGDGGVGISNDDGEGKGKGGGTGAGQNGADPPGGPDAGPDGGEDGPLAGLDGQRQQGLRSDFTDQTGAVGFFFGGPMGPDAGTQPDGLQQIALDGDAGPVLLTGRDLSDGDGQVDVALLGGATARVVIDDPLLDDPGRQVTVIGGAGGAGLEDPSGAGAADGLQNDDTAAGPSPSPGDDGGGPAPIDRDLALSDEDRPVVLARLGPERVGERITAISSDPAFGQALSLSADGRTLTLLPTDLVDALAPGQTLVQEVSVTLTDQAGRSTQSRLRLEIAGTNDAPRPGDDQVAIGDGEAVRVAVLANDSDPDGPQGALRITRILSAPGDLAVTIGADGQLEITPNGLQALRQGAQATRDIVYEVSDAFGATASGTLRLAVTGSNQAPVVRGELGDQALRMTEGQPITFQQLLANDFDPEDTGDGTGLAVTAFEWLTPAGVRLPAASAARSDGHTSGPVPLPVLARNLAQGETETLVLVYTVTDRDGVSRQTRAEVILTGINDAPVAGDDTLAFTAGGEALRLDVLSNDRDPDGPAAGLRLVALGPDTPSWVRIAAGGTQIVVDSGAVSGLGGVGPQGVTITYTVADAGGAQATGRLLLSVTDPVPIASNDSAAAVEGGGLVALAVLANDSDNGRSGLASGLRITAIAPSAPGETGTPALFRIAADGRGLVFDSDAVELAAGASASYSTTYTVADALGQTTTAIVTVTASGRNDAPVASAAGAVLTTLETVPVAITGLAVADPDPGERLSARVELLGPAGGVLLSAAGTTVGVRSLTFSDVTPEALNQALGGLRYLPAAGTRGPVTVRLTVTDGGEDGASAAVVTRTIQVEPAPPLSLGAGVLGYAEDTTGPLGTITVGGGIPGRVHTLTLTAAQANAVLSVDGQAGRSLTLSGTMEQIQGQLARLTFRGPPDAEADTAVRAVLRDTGRGVSLDQTLQVRNTGTNNDLGVLRVQPGERATADDATALRLGGITYGDPDQSDIYTLTVTASDPGSALVRLGVNGSPGASVSLTGLSRAALAQALGSLWVVPQRDGADPAFAVTVTVVDALGRPVTRTVPVAIASSGDQVPGLDGVVAVQAFRIGSGEQPVQAPLVTDDGRSPVTLTLRPLGDGGGTIAYGQVQPDGEDGTQLVLVELDDETLFQGLTLAELQAILDSLVYRPDQDVEGEAQLEIIVSDDAGAVTTTLTFTQLPNSAPQLVSGVNYSLEVALGQVASLAPIVVSDDPLDVLTVVVSPANLGTLVGLSLDDLTTGPLQFTGTAAALNQQLRSLAAAGKDWEGPLELVVSVADGGENGADGASGTITIIQRGDPVVLADGPLSFIEDQVGEAMGTLRLVNGEPGATYQVTLTIADGFVLALLPGGGDVGELPGEGGERPPLGERPGEGGEGPGGGNEPLPWGGGSPPWGGERPGGTPSQLVLSGTVPEINALLARLAVIAAPDQDQDIALDWLIQQFVSEISLSWSGSLDVVAIPVPDRAQLTAPAGPIQAADAFSAVALPAFALTDPDTVDAYDLAIVISDPALAAVAIDDVGFGERIDLSGLSLAQVQALLGEIQVQPQSGAGGTVQVTVTVTDGSGPATAALSVVLPADARPTLSADATALLATEGTGARPLPAITLSDDDASAVTLVLDVSAVAVGASVSLDVRGEGFVLDGGEPRPLVLSDLDPAEAQAILNTLTFDPGAHSQGAPRTGGAIAITVSDRANPAEPGDPDATLTLTITQQAPPVASLSLAASVVEGGTVPVTVTLAAASEWDLTFTLTAGGDTAGVTLPATLRMPAGEMSATVPLSVDDDSVAGNDRSLTLTLGVDPASQGRAVPDGSPTAQLSILDDGDNTPPVFTGPATLMVAEGAAAVGIITAEDADDDRLGFTVTGGADRDRFAIDADTGRLSFVALPDFEAPASAGGSNSYPVEVTVSDGTDPVARLLTVTVTDRNEAPLFATTPVPQGEVRSGTTLSLAGVTVADPDTAEQLSLAITVDDQAARLGLDVPDGEALLTLSGTAAEINAQLPRLVMQTPGVAFPVSLRVSFTLRDGREDGTTPVTASVDIDLLPQDLAPSLDAPQSEQRATAGTGPRPVVPITVGDDQQSLLTLTIALDGGAGTLSFFKPNGQPATLAADDSVILEDLSRDQVQAVLDGLEYDPGQDGTQGASSLIVTIGDQAHVAADSVTIDLLNQAPPELVIDPPSEITEGTSGLIGFELSAPSEWPLEFSLSVGGGDSSGVTLPLTVAFQPGKTRAEVTLSVADDIAVGNDRTLTLTASPQGDSAGRAVVSGPSTVTIVDDGDIPPNVAPQITGPAQPVAVTEGALQAATVTARDANEDPLGFAIVGGDDEDRFAIDGETGVLSFVSAPDFEAPGDCDEDGTYQVEVAVSDGRGGSDRRLLTIEVLDRNEAPVLTPPGDLSGVRGGTTVTLPAFSVADPDLEEVLTLSVSASDPAVLIGLGPPTQPGPLTLTGTAAQINAQLAAVQVATGVVTDPTALILTLTLEDGLEDGVVASSADVTIQVLPPLTLTGPGLRYDEDTPGALPGVQVAWADAGVEYTLELTVAGGFLLAIDQTAEGRETLSLTGTAQALNQALATLSLTPAADADQPVSLAWSLVREDGVGPPVSGALPVAVGLLNEDPARIVDQGGPRATADDTGSHPVGDLIVADPDEGGRYALELSVSDPAKARIKVLGQIHAQISFTDQTLVEIQQILDSLQVVPQGQGADPQWEIRAELTDGSDSTVLNIPFRIVDDTAPILTAPGDAMTVTLGTGARPLDGLTLVDDGRSALSVQLILQDDGPEAVLGVVGLDGLPVEIRTGDGNGARFEGLSVTQAQALLASLTYDPGAVGGGTTLTIKVGDQFNAPANQSLTVSLNHQPKPTLAASVGAPAIEGGGAGQIQLTLSAPLEFETRFAVTLTGSDLAGISVSPSIVVFARGETRATVTVPVADDTIIGNDRSVQVTLREQAGPGPRLGQGDVTVDMAVLNDDAPVNAAPEIIAPESGPLPVAENTTLVTTIQAEDADEDMLVFSLSGGDAGLFKIDAKGELSFQVAPDHEEPGDADGDGVYQVTVTVRDPDLASDSVTLSVQVVDVNEAPTAIDLSEVQLTRPEGIDTSEPVFLGTLQIIDDDLGEVTFSLTGTDAAQFELVGDELYLRAGVTLDFETRSSLSMTIEADDPALGVGPEVIQAFTLTVTDVNEAPSALVLSDRVTSLPETTDTTARLKVATLSVSDDALGTEILGLSGADAALFQIDGDGLYLRAGVALDFETQPSLSVTVTVDDPTLGAGPELSEVFTLTVGDVNEVNLAPTVTSFGGGAAVRVQRADEQTLVGRLSASDPEEAPVTFTITGGADAGRFEIRAGDQLHLRVPQEVDQPTDSDRDGIYEVVVTADDGANAVSQSVSLEVLEGRFQAARTAFTVARDPAGATLLDAGFRVEDTADGSLYDLTVRLPDAAGGIVEVDGEVLDPAGATSFTFAATTAQGVRDLLASLSYTPAAGSGTGSETIEVALAPAQGAPFETVSLTVTTIEDRAPAAGNIDYRLATWHSAQPVALLPILLRDDPGDTVTVLLQAMTPGTDLQIAGISHGTGRVTLSGTAAALSAQLSDLALVLEEPGEAVVQVEVFDGTGGRAGTIVIDSFTTRQADQVVTLPSTAPPQTPLDLRHLEAPPGAPQAEGSSAELIRLQSGAFAFANATVSVSARALPARVEVDFGDGRMATSAVEGQFIAPRAWHAVGSLDSNVDIAGGRNDRFLQDGEEPRVITLADGHVLVAREVTGAAVALSLFDSGGLLIRQGVLSTNSRPEIAATADGGFMVISGGGAENVDAVVTRYDQGFVRIGSPRALTTVDSDFSVADGPGSQLVLSERTVPGPSPRIRVAVVDDLGQVTGNTDVATPNSNPDALSAAWIEGFGGTGWVIGYREVSDGGPRTLLRVLDPKTGAAMGPTLEVEPGQIHHGTSRLVPLVDGSVMALWTTAAPRQQAVMFNTWQLTESGLQLHRGTTTLAVGYQGARPTAVGLADGGALVLLAEGGVVTGIVLDRTGSEQHRGEVGRYTGADGQLQLQASLRDDGRVVVVGQPMVGPGQATRMVTIDPYDLALTSGAEAVFTPVIATDAEVIPAAFSRLGMEVSHGVAVSVGDRVQHLFLQTNSEGDQTLMARARGREAGSAEFVDIAFAAQDLSLDVATLPGADAGDAADDLVLVAFDADDTVSLYALDATGRAVGTPAVTEGWQDLRLAALTQTQAGAEASAVGLWRAGPEIGWVRYDGQGQEVDRATLAEAGAVRGLGLSDVAGLADGGFIAVWAQTNRIGTLDNNAIYGQRLDADGNPLTGILQLNTATLGRQVDPAVTGLFDGGFAVAYRSLAPGGGQVLRVEIYGADTRPLGGTDVASIPPGETGGDGGLTGRPALAELADGSLVVAWTEGARIRFQLFDADGDLSRAGAVEGGAGAGNPHVLALPDGGFQIGFDVAEGPTTGAPQSLYQTFNLDGTPRAALGEALTRQLFEEFTAPQPIRSAKQAPEGRLARFEESREAVGAEDLDRPPGAEDLEDPKADRDPRQDRDEVRLGRDDAQGDSQRSAVDNDGYSAQAGTSQDDLKFEVAA